MYENYSLVTNVHSLKQKAYDLIKNKIIRCELYPGQILDEKLFIEEIGVSRTPIREALNRLEHEDLVKILPRRGIFVSYITMQDLSDLFQLREEIDPFISRLATPNVSVEKLQYFRGIFSMKEIRDSIYYCNIDNEFHTYIANSSGNKYLIKLMDNIYDQNQRIRILSHKIPERHYETNYEHLQIIDYLIQRDADKVANAMREHIINSKNSAIKIGFS